jgi:hypothetical protein
MNPSETTLTNGRAAAASLAAGIGCLAMGALTTLSEASAGVGRLLNFYDPVGPLSGKTIIPVIIWLVSWSLLNGRWKDQELNYPKILVTTLIMVGLGLLGTFPPFFDLLAAD